MPRRVARTRNNGEWTEARYNSFIKSALRSATMRWGPITLAKRNANRGRGKYLCAGCGNIGPASIRIDGKKFNNAVVDHIDPIVDPAIGFNGWDNLISRMFCEVDKLQVLCKPCHDEKTKKETAVAKARRAKEKNDDGL